MDTLIERIKDLCAEIDESISCINCGGCGVFATLMGKKLSKFGKAKIRVVRDYDDTCDNIENAKKNIRNRHDITEWHANGICFHHVIVEFHYNNKVYHIDSSGVFEAENDKSKLTKEWNKPLIPGSLSINQMNILTSSQTGWNRVFDRNDIPTMKYLMGRYKLKAA